MGHASKMGRQKGCYLCKPHKHRDDWPVAP